MTDMLQTCLAVEGEAETEEEYYVSIQRLINSGMWSLQGSMGRTMMAAMESGRCMLGTKPARDYYGNVIPARDWVADGTKGSRSLVAETMGEEWAEMMEKAS